MASPLSPSPFAGNNAALQLNDIHLPESPGFWPLAPGWWILLALLLIAIVWLSLKIRKIVKQRKYQKQILDQYIVLETRLFERSDSEAIAKINIFLRQIAINKYPRADVASLTGTRWLEFLDQTGNTKNFTQGAGHILVDAPYRSGRVLRLNMTEFKPLIRKWIKANLKKTYQNRGGGHE